ncbi:hypothetical protein BES34_018465 [Leptospira inadai serovar Lyme]|uniref:Lipoprotein n=1 Tax=Leptospira inadai serovar Lyme TaxID=293084 RepID=A0ABX4YE44_9LEPT|nr:hypothetical protein BES34_018465 [Leptospira inadai serovar Lyme]
MEEFTLAKVTFPSSNLILSLSEYSCEVGHCPQFRENSFTQAEIVFLGSFPLHYFSCATVNLEDARVRI